MTKLRDLWQAQTELSKLLTTDTLDVVVTWRLSKLVSVLGKLDKSRVLLIEKLGELNGSGILEVKGENTEEFTRQFNELLEEPLNTVSVELDKLAHANLSAVEMSRLSWLIIGPDDE